MAKLDMHVNRPMKNLSSMCKLIASKMLRKIKPQKPKTGAAFWDEFCMGENADRAECRLYET